MTLYCTTDLALERASSLHVVLQGGCVVGGARGGGLLLTHCQERPSHRHVAETNLAFAEDGMWCFSKIVGMHGILQNSRHAWDMELLYNCLEPLSSITIGQKKCVYFRGCKRGYRKVSSLERCPITSSHSQPYHTRFKHNLSLHVPSTHTNAYHYSFFCDAPRTWNLLPHSVTSLPSLNQFKRSVSNFM